MTIDEMWLKSSVLKERLAEEIFYVDVAFEDKITLRLRSEISEWLGCQLTGEKSKATVVLSVKSDLDDNLEAYEIRENEIIGASSVGLLYGFYTYLRLKLTGGKLSEKSAPNQALRMINHWDQVDGTIERGYAGESIFFGRFGSNDNTDTGSFAVKDIGTDIFRNDFTRLEMYARFLASIGINAISLNNVNVRALGTNLIISPYIEKVGEIASLFATFGLRTFLAINWAAPKLIGGLKTSDPLDEKVSSWWRQTIDHIYNVIPDFGGFVVKADSEGEPGPYQYGRNHADGANMLANSFEKYGGLVIWRTFVYNSQTDWRNRKNDRAKAAYENFMPLDGDFADNVILQIKFGPIDFGVREPLMALFGALKKTNQLMEFQITAEYLGHQIDLNYVLPQWLEMIHFDNYGQPKDTIRVNSPIATNSGFVAIGNVGMDENWCGNKLAQANFYGFGRMCWNNDLTAAKILQEWIALTFPEVKEEVGKQIFELLIDSNRTYELYNAPLGVGSMMVPHYHYGPYVNGYEYDRWGAYHFADRNGLGIDRTSATGTGYASLYAPEVAKIFEDKSKTPDEILLFFHYVEYGQLLKSGKTLIQTIYDQHFEGLERVESYLKSWQALIGEIDELIYNNVLERLKLQLENARNWRDQVNTYFYRMSGIPDEKGREIYR
ncbi:Alpha-glucuronidase [Lactococcus lactis subsp. lactis NCDO 2118]|uniref:Alpha-glucuronidase n=1 Tax=Lactococcus lactis subsp. lactis NCDO 2118 TaxID=1117941 RepID=A0ABC8A6D1_LACLL|nr:alpha-glucuronidase [Lactococcus lactis]ABX75554.1 Alpha-glucuronidase [Lactococcus lactis subsp. lactis KF147]AII12810.1 Alpha-glucuronidase [Lactococcus lactis subsp. lactis NCDO 2118]